VFFFFYVLCIRHFQKPTPRISAFAYGFFAKVLCSSAILLEYLYSKIQDLII